MSAQHDKVGRGRPPKSSQFKKGQSGNPAGRPKGSCNLRKLLGEEFTREITVSEGGKPIKLPAVRLVARMAINKAIQGDPKSAKMMLDLMLQLSSNSDKETAETESTEDDNEIIKAFIARQGRCE